MQPTDVSNPAFFHKVVDCQWACPAHTPVPHYIRLIAAGRNADAYMVNWHSNVFPGILGRTCDRPCEPACRRGRVEEEPVAICRLKRVAADNKGDVSAHMPKPAPFNGRRVACVGAGPASLAVARDLAAAGYGVTVFEGGNQLGGFIRSQIPRFRLPESVIDEEVGYITALGVETRIGKRVIVLGGGNTAMDCCRSARRLGGESVTVVVRSGFEEMKASPWEKEDAMGEDIPILNYLVPVSFLHAGGKLTGMRFQKVRAERDANGRRQLLPTGEPDIDMPCDDVLVAVGQENAFPWIERDIGLEFDRWGMPVVDETTLQSTIPNVFFGGDAAFGPKNIIWAVAHAHQAAISIDRLLSGGDVRDRPPPDVTLVSQKMGIHEWSYDNAVAIDLRYKVPHRDKSLALADIGAEVELGFDMELALKEAQRCLNCDIQTVFAPKLCIECDACVDICPVDCITFTANAEEAVLRQSLNAPSLDMTQDLQVADGLKTGRVMVKDEDVCLHCGLCAERCPTGAWDMQRFLLDMAQVGTAPPSITPRGGTGLAESIAA